MSNSKSTKQVKHGWYRFYVFIEIDHLKVVGQKQIMVNYIKMGSNFEGYVKYI